MDYLTDLNDVLPKPSLGIYLTAAYPDSKTFAEWLGAASTEADFVEIGVPTGNPKYDGPLIRRTHRKAEVHGLEALRRVPRVDKPVVVMAYVEDYVGRLRELAEVAAQAGAVSLLLPDLLIDYPEVLGEYLDACRSAGLRPSFFLPGKFPYAVARKAAEADPLFVYLGLYAATGIKLPVYVERNIRVLRSVVGDIYVVAGFAISSPEMVRSVINAGADGVVVGSALIRRLEEGGTAEAIRFLASLRTGLGKP